MTIPQLPFTGQQLRATMVAMDDEIGTKLAGDHVSVTNAREWTAATVEQAEAEAGTATTRRAWTAQRVFQAIAAWWAASAAKTKLDGIEAGAQVNYGDVILVACSDETTNLTAGTAKATFRMPWAATLTGVRASVSEAPTGSTLVVDINEAGSSVLSTKLSIDASETSSTTAATAAVISDTALANDAVITIDIDQIGSTNPGKGLKVTLYVTRV